MDRKRKLFFVKTSANQTVHSRNLHGGECSRWNRETYESASAFYLLRLSHYFHVFMLEKRLLDLEVTEEQWTQQCAGEVCTVHVQMKMQVFDLQVDDYVNIFLIFFCNTIICFKRLKQPKPKIYILYFNLV